MYELESTIRARLTGRHSTFQFGGHRGRLVMMFDLLVAYIVGCRSGSEGNCTI